ncbi:FeoA family protein [Thermosediminibacter litoriperuensis]|uniref:DtxR family Mn-dependent transcriptional regulator/ferrous iron transport protein A n=1 Tax=Thermosediminibacter litoriperuensis TaxID=291989 RepID=A0A5S5AXY8_9FIRM|nr:FeoA family protein [Thermosediminibacter litoriperuensis]TYP57832.1 DtxR family Mn-dependent transcriptional regulator/ferrous iron transport protein A [Thermosediminibacter litoriperuensis]
MEKHVITLDRLPIGKTGRVAAILHKGLSRRRFLDLGFVPGTLITTYFTSFTGDPTAYRIRGTTIALRKEDSSKILVITE